MTVVGWARASAAGEAGHTACLQTQWPGQQCAAACSSSHGEPWRGLCWCRSSSRCMTARHPACTHAKSAAGFRQPSTPPNGTAAACRNNTTGAAQTDRLQACSTGLSHHKHSSAALPFSCPWLSAVVVSFPSPCLSVYVSVCRYFLSTALGLFNKKVVGKNYGVFGKGAFPGAPQQQQQQQCVAHTCGAAGSSLGNTACASAHQSPNCGDANHTLKCTLLAPAPLHMTGQQAVAASTECTHTHTYASVFPPPLCPTSCCCCRRRAPHTHSPAVSYRCPVCISKPVGPAGVCHRARGAGW